MTIETTERNRAVFRTLPRESTIRNAPPEELPALIGLDNATIRQAEATYRGITEIEDPAMRQRILKVAVDRSGRTGLDPVVARLGESAPSISGVAEFLDVAGVGPKRLVDTVIALAASDVPQLLLEARVDDVAASLDALVTFDRPARRLAARLLDTADGTFTADTPGLDLVRRTFLDPELTADPSFDAKEFRRSLNQLASFVVATTGTGEDVSFGDGDTPATTTGDDTGDDDTPSTFVAPPSPWTDGFVTAEKLKRPFVSPFTVDLPTVTPPVVTLGSMTSTARIVETLVKIERAAADLYAAAEGAAIDTIVPNLPGLPGVEQLIEFVIRLTIAPIARGNLPTDLIPTTPIPFGGPQSLTDAVNRFNTTVAQLAFLLYLPGPATATTVALSRPSIEITGPPGTDFTLTTLSRMTSTYTYGRGRGTFSTNGLSDRPWFALLGTPRIQVGAANAPGPVLQLGESGEGTSSTTTRLTVPPSGVLRLPLEVNGNYGQLRLILDELAGPASSRLVPPLFVVDGPYEEQVAVRETQRFAARAADLANIQGKVRLILNVLDLVQSIAGIVPVVGSAIGAAVDAAEKSFGLAADAAGERYAAANRSQRSTNLTAAEKLPASTPVGSKESVVPLR